MKGSDRMTVTATSTKSKITVRTAPAPPATVKKVNKWDVIMSKISEPTSKPLIKVKEVKSRFSQSLLQPPNPHPHSQQNQLQQQQQLLQQKGLPKSSFHIDNNKSRSRVHLNNQRNHGGGAVTPTTKGSRHLLIDHSDQDGSSVQSSTESESSLQDQSSGPSSTIMRMKKSNLTRNRQASDASSASDISTRVRQRSKMTNNGASKLALTSTSSTTLSTNPSTMTTTTITPRTTEKITKKTFTSVPALNHGTTRNVPRTIHDASKHSSYRDRNRMGPDGKLGADSSDGRSSQVQVQTNNNNNVSSHQHQQNGGGSSSNNNHSSIKSNPPLVNNNNNTAVSSSLIVDSTNHSNNNNNNNAPSSPCINTASLTLENSRLKEQLSLQCDLNAELQTKLDQANSNGNNSKILMEAELKLLNQKFLAMTILAQRFNEQRVAIEERLHQEKELAQQRETRLVAERVEEIQNLRVEFERERECMQEEILVMRKTDESQVEKLKELGAEISQKEELLRQKTQEYEDENDKLKRKHAEELEVIKDKYKQEAQEELIKSQVLKRTLSSPQPTNSSNSTNDVLQKEINSLHVVIDMRNQEIRSLRQELLTQSQFLEDLSSCKEQNKGLSAKVEDLNAQLVKSRQDKHDMQEKYAQAENLSVQSVHQLNQLQLENEQLKWRLQSIRTDERVTEIMSKSAVQLGCDAHMNLDYETAITSLLETPKIPTNGVNGCVK